MKSPEGIPYFRTPYYFSTSLNIRRVEHCVHRSSPKPSKSALPQYLYTPHLIFDYHNMTSFTHKFSRVPSPKHWDPDPPLSDRACRATQNSLLEIRAAR